MRRAFSMPNSETFSITPIREFIERHLVAPSIDPFARDSLVADVRNDLNPATSAQNHEDAVLFCDRMLDTGQLFATAILDPPYSPRQISECYQSIGKEATTEDTQNGRLYREVRRRLADLLVPGGVALQFGWNSCGWGEGFELIDLLLVNHGGAHNDTICTAWKKKPTLF